MRNKPRIRFKGFTEDWEQRKLSDITEIVMGQSPSSKNYTDNPNDNILVQGNADLKDGKVVPRLWTKEITKPIDKDGIILTVRAPVGDVARTDYKVVLGRGVAGIKGNDYIYQFLQKLQNNRYWVSLSSGSTFESINSNDIKDLIIDIPSVEEQTKISMLLNNVNSIITLHQRKLEKLKLAKKALLQKLFPKNGSQFPEIRFKGFTDAWEQRELSSLTEYISTGKSRFVIKEFGEYAILGSTNVIGYDDAYDYDGNFILTARVGANAGQLYRYSGKVKITDNTVFLMSDRSQFIYYALTHFDLRRLSFGTGQPLVKSSELQKLKLCVPVSKSEQEKIGEIFNNIDNIITLHQRKLDKLQDMKKGLLQKMFV